MDAIKEIGLQKLIKYLLFTLWELVFRFLIFSPLRVFWLKLFGAKIGKNTIIGNIHFMNLYRKGTCGLTILDNCFIGDRVILDLADKIIIGNHVTLSEEVFVLTHTNVGYKNHPLQESIPSFTKQVQIDSGSFIGIRATIMPGVKIGEKSAVGACSLVLHDIPSGELHAGIPAKLIKKLIYE